MFPLFDSDVTDSGIKAGHVFQKNENEILQVPIPWDWSFLPLGSKIKTQRREHSLQRSCSFGVAKRQKPRGPWGGCSLFSVQGEVQSLRPLVEKHVGVGGQDLVQAGFPHRVVGHPKPLGAEGEVRRGGATAVRDEMS